MQALCINVLYVRNAERYGHIAWIRHSYSYSQSTQGAGSRPVRYVVTFLASTLYSRGSSAHMKWETGADYTPSVRRSIKAGVSVASPGHSQRDRSFLTLWQCGFRGFRLLDWPTLLSGAKKRSKNRRVDCRVKNVMSRRVWNAFFVQVPLMDIAGRRILLLVPMLAMIIDLVVLTAFLLTQVQHLSPFYIYHYYVSK